jgi:hypothetical protein
MEDIKKLIDKYFAELIVDFENDREMELRELSNNSMESAAIRQDKRMVDISTVAYALAKLMSKPHLFKSDQWNRFKAHILQELRAKKSMGEALKRIIEDVNSFDIDLGNYVRDIIEKARIKQASRAYALGISLKQASELTGANFSSLLDYVGATKIHDRPFTKSKSIVDRYKLTKKALGE